MKQLNDKMHIYYFMCEYNGIRCSSFHSVRRKKAYLIFYEQM